MKLVIAAAVTVLAFAAPATATTSAPALRYCDPATGLCVTIDLSPAQNAPLPGAMIGVPTGETIPLWPSGEPRIYVPPAPTELRGGGGSLTDALAIQ